LDVARDLPQVAIVPGGLGAVEDPWRAFARVPADSEPVTVGRLCAHARLETLVDQGELALVEDLVHPDRLTVVGEPAAHGASLSLCPVPCTGARPRARGVLPPLPYESEGAMPGGRAGGGPPTSAAGLTPGYEPARAGSAGRGRVPASASAPGR